MNSNDYVKFITQTFVQYMEQPKSERKKQRIERKQEKAPVLFRWFGIVPYLLFYGMKGTKKEIINQTTINKKYEQTPLLGLFIFF